MERRSELKRDGKKAQAFAERGRGALRVNPEKPLRVSDEKARAFAQRGREASAAGMGRSRGRKRQRPPEGPLAPQEWREVVANASGLRCIVTRTRARDAFDPLYEAHHPLPKRELRARGLHAHVWDPRNGVFVVQQVHARQEGAFRRIPASKLPSAVWEFCKEMDAIDGTSWATELVRRLHPDQRR